MEKNRKGKRRCAMSLLGNFLWLIFGGFLSGLAWIGAGILWCITIIGIPVGMQCFKLASISFMPFGRFVEYGGGAPSFLLNVIWLCTTGWVLALGNFMLGAMLCITVIGIPFGKQFFKIAKLSLAPFGAYIVN
jgi:uncharacterized membrane protein YccF (DUF307 family)